MQDVKINNRSRLQSLISENPDLFLTAKVEIKVIMIKAKGILLINDRKDFEF